MTRRARATASVLLAAGGGLALAGGTAAGWVHREEVRDVGGVTVTDSTAVSGLELAPQGLAIGLAAAVGGLALLLLGGRARVALGVLLTVSGLAALVSVPAGMAAAPPGAVGAGVVAAISGACAVAVSGLLALRPAAPPRLPARYDLDAPPDDEWHLAAGDGNGGAGQGQRG